MEDEIKEIGIDVQGGILVAKIIPDPNYPGIKICFVPDHGVGETPLAVLEQSDGILQLCSYMNTSREDPTVYKGQYDTYLLAQIAYSFYLKYDGIRRKDSFEDFRKFDFKDRDLMKDVLPPALLEQYEAIPKEFFD